MRIAAFEGRVSKWQAAASPVLCVTQPKNLHSMMVGVFFLKWDDGRILPLAAAVEAEVAAYREVVVATETDLSARLVNRNPRDPDFRRIKALCQKPGSHHRFACDGRTYAWGIEASLTVRDWACYVLLHGRSGMNFVASVPEGGRASLAAKPVNIPGCYGAYYCRRLVAVNGRRLTA